MKLTYVYDGYISDPVIIFREAHIVAIKNRDTSIALCGQKTLDKKVIEIDKKDIGLHAQRGEVCKDCLNIYGRVTVGWKSNHTDTYHDRDRQPPLVMEAK